MASRAIIQQALVVYSYVGLWILLSASVILYNKYVLTVFGFPYPVSLTMIHMAFCSALAFVMVRVLKIVSGVKMNLDTYIRRIVPIGFLFAIVLWMGNSAYVYLSVAFIQMVKALMPCIVYVVGRIVSIQLILTRADIKLNSVTTLYYVSPVCFVFLTIPFVFVELPHILAAEVIPVNPVVLLSSAVLAFALNISVFLLIGKTSALTMNVAGVVKDWILIFISSLLFDAPIASLQLWGYLVAFIAVCHYNFLKFEEKERASSGGVVNGDGAIKVQPYEGGVSSAETGK